MLESSWVHQQSWLVAQRIVCCQCVAVMTVRDSVTTMQTSSPDRAFEQLFKRSENANVENSNEAFEDTFWRPGLLQLPHLSIGNT